MCFESSIKKQYDQNQPSKNSRTEYPILSACLSFVVPFACSQDAILKNKSHLLKTRTEHSLHTRWLPHPTRDCLWGHARTRTRLLSHELRWLERINRSGWFNYLTFFRASPQQPLPISSVIHIQMEHDLATTKQQQSRAFVFLSQCVSLNNSSQYQV